MMLRRRGPQPVARIDRRRCREKFVSDEDLRPSFVLLAGGSLVIASISIASLPWPAALASTLLGTLMIAGAEIDARTFLLPDLVTGATFVGGILAAPVLNPYDPGFGLGMAVVRAVATAADHRHAETK